MNPRTQSPSSRPLDRFAPAPDRWRWMALSGVAAGSAAATSAAFAGVVQISQVGNEVTSSADNLRADLTGDAVDDLMGLVGYYGPFTYTWSASTWTSGSQTYTRPAGWAAGHHARAIFSALVSWSSMSYVTSAAMGGASFAIGGTGSTPNSNTAGSGYYNWAGRGTATQYGNAKEGSTGLIPVTFTDARINGGQPTNGLLEVRAFSTSQTEHTVRLVRLVFDDASTAKPAGVVAGGTNYPEFRATIYAERTAHAASVSNLSKKISTANKKLKAANKKLKKARKLGQAAKAKNLQRTAKKLKKQLKSLRSQLSRLRANPI